MSVRFVRCLPVIALWMSAAHAWSQTLPPLVQADGALHPGWRYVGFPKKKADIPPTLFEAGKVDDDAALKVCTMFDHPLDRVPFVERSVSGEAPPAATICYIWDSGHAAGLQGANPYTRRVRYLWPPCCSAPTATTPRARAPAESTSCAGA